MAQTKGGVDGDRQGERRKERTIAVAKDRDLNSVHASPFRYANGVVPPFSSFSFHSP